jgi:hypothetical protein
VRETVDIYPRANGVERRGTNSTRLFTPREREALAKSKVHQWSQAHGVYGWSSHWSQNMACLPVLQVEEFYSIGKKQLISIHI